MPLLKIFPIGGTAGIIRKGSEGRFCRRHVENCPLKIRQRKCKCVKENKGKTKMGIFNVKNRTAEIENRQPKKIEKQKTGAETTDEPPTRYSATSWLDLF